MNLPRWAQLGGAASILGGLAALLFSRERIIAAALLSPTPGAAAAPPLPLAGQQPIELVGGEAIRLAKGRTYFAVVKTTGVVSAAASPDRVAAEAVKLGFSDVFVSTDRPDFFPGSATSDFYVRATYRGEGRDVARTKAVFLGSVSVVDVWIASP